MVFTGSNIYEGIRSFLLVLWMQTQWPLFDQPGQNCLYLKRVLTNFGKRVWSIFMHLQSYGYQTARIILKEISEKKKKKKKTIGSDLNC